MIIKMIGTELSPQSVSDMYYIAGVIRTAGSAMW